MSTRLYVFAVIATLSTAPARAAEEAAAYLVAASDGAPVTTASGACVRTSEWNPAASYRDCIRYPPRSSSRLRSSRHASTRLCVPSPSGSR